MTLEQLNIISQYAEKKCTQYLQSKSRAIDRQFHEYGKCQSSNWAKVLEENDRQLKYWTAVLNNVNAQIEEFIKLTVIL